jgi:class 3 adenylate cyclase
VLKGFVEPMPIYRIEQRHRTRVIPEIYILFLDLHGFRKIMDAGPVTKIERTLDMLDAVTYGTAQDFGGTVRFNQGDSYCVTFTEAARAMAGAERLICKWDAIRHLEQFDCTINIGLHRGTLYAFRSFLYGRDVDIASQLQIASTRLLTSDENGIFVTNAVHSALFGTPWHNRLQPIALQQLLKPPLLGIAGYRLCEGALENESRDPL